MSQLDDPIRAAMVGCGRLAEVGYLPALRRVEGMRLVAVADPDRARRERIAALAAAAPRPEEAAPDTPAPATFASLEDLLDGAAIEHAPGNRPSGPAGAGIGPARSSRAGLHRGAGGVDVVLIATPPATHLPQAERAAAAGLPALVEKPPAAELGDAERLAALQPVPWIGFNRRFAQGMELADRVPAASPLEMRLELRYRRRAWRPHSTPPRSGGGDATDADADADDALLDLGPHLIDLVLHLGGAAPLAARALRVERDRAELELRTTRGAARIRCATNRPHRELIEIRDGGGGLLARSRTPRLLRLPPPLGRREHPLVASLARELDAVSAAVRGETPGPLASATDGLAAMRVVAATRRSAREGGEVPIAEPPTPITARSPRQGGGGMVAGSPRSGARS